MTDTKTSHQDKVAALTQTMQTADFPTLLKAFNTASCETESYDVATWMYSRFPNESKQLLPLVKDEELPYNCTHDPKATTSQWAAALAAAKWMHSGATAEIIAATSEAQLHERAKKIYEAEHKDSNGTPAKPKACPIER